MYVHKDTLENQFLGDLKAPVLILVPVQFVKHNQLDFPRIRFLLISRGSNGRIAVSTKNDRGQLILFESETTTVALLFTKMIVVLFRKKLKKQRLLLIFKLLIWVWSSFIQRWFYAKLCWLCDVVSFRFKASSSATIKKESFRS